MKKLLLAALVAASLASCMSNQARDEALLPAVNLAWGDSEAGVRSDVERGIADAVEDGDLLDSSVLDAVVGQIQDALAEGDRFELRTIPWALLAPYGERGIQDRIDDGEMGEMVAESLRERLRNFTKGFTVLLSKYMLIPASSTKEHWLPNGGGRATDPVAVAIASAH